MTTPFQIASRAAVVGALTVASALWTLPGRAGIHEDEAGTLQLVINAKLEKAVDELIDPEVVARELFLPYPVEPPTKQKDEIEAEIQAKVTAMGDEKYADQTDEYFSKLAREIYSIYLQWDKVTVRRKDNTYASGTIREIESQYIQIANAKIYRSELDEESLTHFDQERTTQKREAYVRLKKEELAQKRKAWEATQRAEVEREIYVDAGYIQIKGEWVTQKEFFDGRIADLKERWREHLLGKVASFVYYDNGYVLYNNEWMKPGERDRQIAAAAAAAAGQGGGKKPATTDATAPTTTSGDADDFFNNPG